MDYFLLASSAYITSPLFLSVMYLTIAELWVCLDKLASGHKRLLLDYDLEFPLDLFHPLLLPKKGQMERLLAIKKYILKRKARCIPGYPSPFRLSSAPNSIGNRYFRDSSKHQNLRATIEHDATIIRDNKKAELHRLQADYATLQSKAAVIGHTEEPISEWDWYTRSYRSRQ